MIKYTFLIHHARRQAFIDALGKLGIVDVSTNSWEPTGEQRSLLNEINNYKQAIDKLTALKSAYKGSPLEKLTSEAVECDAEELLQTYSLAHTRNEQLKTALSKTIREQKELEIWGNFSPELIRKLQEYGIRLYFFSAGSKSFDPAWENEYRIEIVHADNTRKYFVVIADDGSLPILPGASAIKMPDTTAREKTEEITAIKTEIDRNEEVLARCTAGIPRLKTRMEQLQEILSEDIIKSNNITVADDTIYIMEGWVPEQKTKEVDELFDSNPDVIVLKDRPTPDDNPPILLKNNKFARLCEMISNLYSLPSYHEVDLTPFFAPFFIFFVGICFGDLAYGTMVFIAALVVHLRTKNPSIKPITSLVMWCAFASMLMGVITGNFAGIPLNSIPALSHVQFMEQMSMFSFALLVGGVQLVYAMFVKAFARIKRFGFKYGISTLAWIAVLFVTGLTFVLPEQGIDFTMHSPTYIILLCLCLLLNILFLDPSKKNLLNNFGSGLWELYNSITGLLGDILSYIRLFALGLSSGIIASVFNDLAVGMSGDIPVVKYIVMILILLIGHGINIFMSAISSFVHPLRLTFVEFYKNAGFEGGGRAYKPFKKHIK